MLGLSDDKFYRSFPEYAALTVFFDFPYFLNIRLTFRFFLILSYMEICVKVEPAISLVLQLDLLPDWGVVNGVYHSVSPKYLQSYVNEYSFRYNHRNDEKPMFQTFLSRISSRIEKPSSK